MNKQPTFDPSRLFFLDETNANTRMHRSYGRGPIGERVPDAIPYRHYESTTLLSVISLQGVVASALSRLNFGIEPLQFHSRFVDGELPIDGALLPVDTG
jgi:hypothetical protein